MRLLKILFFALLFVNFSCSNDCDDNEDVTIRITNNTAASRLAVKLPNLCWKQIEPTDYLEVRVSNFSQGSLSAFTAFDDEEAFGLAPFYEARVECENINNFVNPPEESDKITNFIFNANSCMKGVDVNIYAENNDVEGVGISSVSFRQE